MNKGGETVFTPTFFKGGVMSLRYFASYSGGIKDVVATYELLRETSEKFLLSSIATSIPELREISLHFPEDINALLQTVNVALKQSEDEIVVLGAESQLRSIVKQLQGLAQKWNVELSLGANMTSTAVAKEQETLESKVLNLLNFCLSKIVALLAFKRVQINLESKR